MITCARCRKRFTGDAPTQAAGCAADIFGDHVIGFYGSAVADMEKLIFARDRRPDGLDGGQICDACILQLEGDGVLLRTEETQSAFRMGPRRSLSCEEMTDLLDGFFAEDDE